LLYFTMSQLQKTFRDFDGCSICFTFYNINVFFCVDAFF